MRIGGGGTVGFVLAAVVAGLVVERAVPGAHVAVGLGLAACVVVIARAGGLTASDLGLVRSTWPCPTSAREVMRSTTAVRQSTGVRASPE
jgi:hypothetical protein